MDDSDNSDEGKKKKQPKKDKQLNPKKPTLGSTKKMKEDRQNQDFFDDL